MSPSGMSHVGDRAGHGQLNRCAATFCAADLEFGLNAACALLHANETVMSYATATFESDRVDADSVVRHMQ